MRAASTKAAELRSGRSSLVAPFGVDTREIGDPCWVIRRTRRNTFARITAAFCEQPRARRETPLALAPARAKARVTFQRFDVTMAEGDGLLEVVERDVLAA